MLDRARALKTPCGAESARHAGTAASTNKSDFRHARTRPRPRHRIARSRIQLQQGRLRPRAWADLQACRHQPAWRQACDGLQPPVAPPARDRTQELRELSSVAGGLDRPLRRCRMAGVRELP